MSVVILILYGAMLSFILLFSIVQLHLTIAYLRAKDTLPMTPPTVADRTPMVTVQLPVYNERNVVERLIDNVADLDWPRDRLEVQVLDDSTDETTSMAKERIAFWRAQGFDMTLVRRPDRSGFKAGALAYGMGRAKGDLLAIFDADFLPDPGFLRAVSPLFNDPSIGMVQTRWGHVNRDSNLLTRLQAFGLDAHFTVEQVGRNASGHFINFNGTAGIWRKTCIADSGGWQSDTLTEDLDLSYRAQLRGWKFRYVEGISSPAELPAMMGALKIQQFRWNKGAAECVRKNLPKVLRRSGLPFSTKLHAMFHLMNSTVFVCILGTALLSVPVLLVKYLHPELGTWFNAAVIFTFALIALAAFYWVAHRERMNGWKERLGFLLTFPLFLSVSMGLSLHNSIAVLEGYSGRRSPFHRTPKTGALMGGVVGKADYRRSSISWRTLVEGGLALYALAGIIIAIRIGDPGLLPYHILLALGFGSVFYYSIVHSMRTVT